MAAKLFYTISVEQNPNTEVSVCFFLYFFRGDLLKFYFGRVLTPETAVSSGVVRL